VQQLQQIEFQFDQQRKVYEQNKAKITAEINYFEGQVNLIAEIDPSVVQGPQDVNPEALKPKPADQEPTVPPSAPEPPAALAGTVPVAPPMDPPAPSAQSVPAIDVTAAHEHAVAGGEMPAGEPAAPAGE
jgi:hypothetical protein